MNQTTGTEILTLALKQRNKNPQTFARIAAELKVGKETLQQFMTGAGALTAAQKMTLAGLLFDGATFDGATDRLRNAFRHEPQSYVLPPVIDPGQLLNRMGMPECWGPHQIGGVILEPVPPTPKRPGCE